MRKLVTVRKIAAIEPIPGADFIEKATVDGWKCVVSKGEFKPGDACVYFEIDSFLEEGDPRYDFLMKDKIVWEGITGVRIRTREFRGQIAQGMAKPLSLFPEINQLIAGMSEAQIRNTDFTETIGVRKWEQPIPAELLGSVKGAMPSYIPRTESERIQNIPDILVDQADEDFEESIKIDGYSMTVFMNRKDSGICGRNWWFDDDVQNAYTDTAEAQCLLQALDKTGRSLALQGELTGPGIHGNPEKLPEKEFLLFRIIDTETGEKLVGERRDEVVRELVANGAKLRTVPVNGVFKLKELGSVEDLLKRAVGPSMHPETSREGLVFVSLRDGTSIKVISNKFLLKNKNA